MITLNDCRAFCEVDPATVARVTRQEQLPEILAIACAQTRLMKARRCMRRTRSPWSRLPAYRSAWPPEERHTMMTMQARESLAPIRHPGRPLRTYPVDSPRAKARLLVLALLADGRVDAAELDGLAKYQAFAELGISRDDFFQVLYDFCADAAGTARGQRHLPDVAGALDHLFAEVCGAAERQTTVTPDVRPDPQRRPSGRKRSPPVLESAGYLAPAAGRRHRIPPSRGGLQATGPTAPGGIQRNAEPGSSMNSSALSKQ
jgi:hypothetical protein